MLREQFAVSTGVHVFTFLFKHAKLHQVVQDVELKARTLTAIRGYFSPHGIDCSISRLAKSYTTVISRLLKLCGQPLSQ